MFRVHEEYDADLIPENTPTDHEIGQNRFAANCSVCGARVFVDETMIERVHRALSNGFESPAVCEECELEADLPGRGSST